MKITAISDTHGLHELLDLQGGDILIHAGDVSRSGTKEQIVDFLNWFKVQPFTYKIFIAGNHDFFFERKSSREIKEIIPPHVIYLNDDYVMVEKLKIWGSPVQPWFHNWAFNRQRGAEIKQHWDLIPNDIDLLITHGPAFGILDKTVENSSVGCEDLLKAVKRIKPKVHISGHIHEAYGREVYQPTLFLNASVLNVSYRLANAPHQFEI